MASRNTCEPAVPPWKSRSNASGGSDQQQRALARRCRRPATARRRSGPRSRTPGRDRREPTRMRRRRGRSPSRRRRSWSVAGASPPRPASRSAGRAAREPRRSGTPSARARAPKARKNGEPPHVGAVGSRPAGKSSRPALGSVSARLTPAGDSPPSERRRARERLMRSRSQATPATARLSANAVGWRRETSAAKSARPRKSAAVGSSARAVAGAQAAVEQRDLAEHLARAHRGELELAARRAGAARPDSAVDDQHSSPSASSPCCQRTSPGASSRRPDPGELRELRRPGCRRSSGTAARKERRASTSRAVRHRGRASRSRARRSSDAVIIEYSGTSSHVDVSSVSGSEAISSERGAVAGPHRHSPSRSRVLAAERVPEAHVRQVGLEQRVVVRVPAVVEREAGRDEASPVVRKRFTGEEVSIPWRARTSRRIRSV